MTEGRRNGAASKYYMEQGITQLREACGADAIKPDRIPCLKCQMDFNSPDKIRVRICYDCKRSDSWVGSQESDSIYPAGHSITGSKKRPDTAHARSLRSKSIRA